MDVSQSTHPPVPGSPARRPPLWIVAAGLISLALYAGMPDAFARLTSAEPSFVSQVFPWVKAVTRETLGPIRGRPDNFFGSAPFLLLCAGLFAVYAWALRRARGVHSASEERWIFGFGAAFLALFVFLPVMLSTDVFAYAFYGRLVSVYGGDAYSLKVAFDPADPYLLLYGHEYFGSVYGPLWTIISAGIVRLTGTHVGLTVLLFRLVAAGSILAGAGFLRSALRRIAPESVALGTVFFLWNPVTVMEAAGGCHNDATLVALLLCGVWLHTRGHRPGAAVAMTLAVLLKVIAAPVLLLYAWAVLRESPTWRDRLAFLGRAALGAGLVAFAAFRLANAREPSPVSKFSSSPDFYLNNYQEIAFKQLRRWLGEDEELLDTPMYFRGWWMQAQTEMPLREDASGDARTLRTVRKGERVLVFQPQWTAWLRVYDPVTRKKGYMLDDSLDQVGYPDNAPDAESDLLQSTPMDWPTVIRANEWMRRAMTALFAAFGLIAAWRTTNFDRFLFWSCAALGAVYLTVATQIWPWYALWTLAFGALKPRSAPARFALLMSAGLTTLYAVIGFGYSRLDWIYEWRSIPAVVLPTVVWAVWTVRNKIAATLTLDAVPPARILEI